jgi:hypothetical protein
MEMRLASQTLAVIIAVGLECILVPRPALTQSPKATSSRVQMQNEGGTYVVPVLINKVITLKFVVDSGAADVAVPADVVLTLLRSGTIDESDFVGAQTYKLADGTAVPSVQFRLRSLKVGEVTAENVLAGITPTEGSLLLGQSFLGRFKSWAIDNTNHVLVLEPVLTASFSHQEQEAEPIHQKRTDARRERTADTDNAAARAKMFVQEYETRWSLEDVPDAAWLSSVYADEVDYYGRRSTRASVVAEKQAFAAKWPQRSYTVEPTSMIARCDVAVCTVTGVVHFTVRGNGKGLKQGVATFGYSLAADGRSFRIIGESGRVLQRETER